MSPTPVPMDSAPPRLADYRARPPHPARREGGRRPTGGADGPTSPPLVTVVTVVRDAAVTLERTILSVLDQGYPNVEYVVIDGASTDGTLDVVRRHEHRLAYWLSEPDRGIGDAFNKGVAAARGAFIAIQSADDWMAPDQIERGVRALLDSGADFAFGDVVMHATDGAPLYRINGDPAYAAVIRSRMPELPHNTVLARRELYERFGLFDLRYRLAMDYDWLLRVHLGGARGVHVPGLVGHLGGGGASDSGYLGALRESHAISVAHGYPPHRAAALFGLRCARGWLRRTLERGLPPRLRALPRRLANRHCGAATAS